MGQLIMHSMYPGKEVSDLQESDKQIISALSTLAAGLAGGVTGGGSASALAGAQAGKNAVENNALSLGTGMTSSGSAAQSWNQYSEEHNLTPEQKQAGLDKLTQGDLPDGANITKVIVNGYKDGVLIAGAAYLGPAASVGKVVGSAVIAAMANGTYQWFDINSVKNQSLPENQQTTWDYWGSASAAVTGALAPGRGLLQNVGIATTGAALSNGADIGAIGIAAGSAGLGWGFGEYAPGGVNSLTGKDAPGFIFEAIGSLGTEFLGGYTQNLLNTLTPQKSSEK